MSLSNDPIVAEVSVRPPDLDQVLVLSSVPSSLSLVNRINMDFSTKPDLDSECPSPLWQIGDNLLTPCLVLKGSAVSWSDRTRGGSDWSAGLAGRSQEQKIGPAQRRPLIWHAWFVLELALQQTQVGS